MRFSIIVPVYNVEDYLQKCLESIVSQSFEDYEVIIVDDETPDNSMAIAQLYVDSYPERFRIIHQKNKGLGGARNTGVAAAKGEYLVFLDSDDYVHSQLLEILDQRVRDNPCEMLIFNYYTVLPSGQDLSECKVLRRDELITDIEGKMALLQTPPAAWNKVYLRSFYVQSGVRFPEKTLYEDVVTRILVAKAGRIQLCPECLYYYVQRPGSIMNSQVSPRVLEIKKVVELVRNAYISEGIYEEYKDAIDAAMVSSLVSVIEGIIQRTKNHPHQKDLVQYLLENFQEYPANNILHPIVKSKVDCLLRGNRLEYILRFSMIPQLKKTLLRIPAINKLNEFRNR